jgi:phage-related holin
MVEYFQNFMSMVDGIKLTLLMALIIANFLTGIAVSIKNKTFNLKEAGKFLYERVLPYVVGYFGVGVVATIDASWGWAVPATWAVILATLVGAILQNLKELGVPIPSALAGGKSERE